jgi:hypothetical protein
MADRSFASVKKATQRGCNGVAVGVNFIIAANGFLHKACVACEDGETFPMLLTHLHLSQQEVLLWLSCAGAA